MTKKAKPVLLDEDGYLTINPNGKSDEGGGGVFVIDVTCTGTGSNGSLTGVETDVTVGEIANALESGFDPVVRIIGLYDMYLRLTRHQAAYDPGGDSPMVPEQFNFSFINGLLDGSDTVLTLECCNVLFVDNSGETVVSGYYWPYILVPNAYA